MKGVCLERAVRLYVQQVCRRQIEELKVSQSDSSTSASYVTKLQHQNMRLHRQPALCGTDKQNTVLYDSNSKQYFQIVVLVVSLELPNESHTRIEVVTLCRNIGIGGPLSYILRVGHACETKRVFFFVCVNRMRLVFALYALFGTFGFSCLACFATSICARQATLRSMILYSLLLFALRLSSYSISSRLIEMLNAVRRKGTHCVVVVLLLLLVWQPPHMWA